MKEQHCKSFCLSAIYLFLPLQFNRFICTCELALMTTGNYEALCKAIRRDVCKWSSARLPAYLSSTRLKSSRGQRNARPAYVTFPTSISMKGDLVKSGFNSVFCGSLDSKVFLFNKITLSRCLLQ